MNTKVHSTKKKGLCLSFFALSALYYVTKVADEGFAATVLSLLKYLTMWQTNLTIVYFALEYFQLANYETRNTIFTIVLSVTTAMNVVYWVFEHKHNLKPGSSKKEIFCTYLVHTYTSCYLIAELFCTNYVFSNRHLLKVLKFYVSYIIVNILWTFISGTPVYNIVQWNDFFSIVFVSFTIILISCSFYFWRFLGILKLTAYKYAIIK